MLPVCQCAHQLAAGEDLHALVQHGTTQDKQDPCVNERGQRMLMGDGQVFNSGEGKLCKEKSML